jgi:hypothetical protein
MPPLTNVQIAQQLPGVVAEIQKILSAAGSYHGVLRGSMEAALAEAQGAEIIGPDGRAFNHLQNLKDTLNALTNNRDTLRGFLAQICTSGDYSSVSKLSESLEPLLEAATDKQQVMSEAVELAESLQKTNPGRFAGVAFGQGGLGAQTGRTVASLVSEQLKVLAGVLRQRGIDPTLLPRNVAATANVVMEEIEEQPVAAETAAAEAAVAAAASRTLISAFLARAGAAASGGFWRAVGAALEAMWSIGGRLITIPVIILDEDGNILGTRRPRTYI